MKESICFIIGYIILGIGALLSCYIYFWLMVLKQILLAGQSFMIGTFTFVTGLSLAGHILLGWIPAVIVAAIAFLIAAVIMNYGADYEK